MKLPEQNDYDETPDDNRSPIEFFEAGFQEFEAGKYFEAHDTWEEFWQWLRGPDRRFLQGLIHLAIGSYHYENVNHVGARSQWSKSRDKIGRYPEGHWGVETREWVNWIEAYMNNNGVDGFPPRLKFDRTRFPTDLKMAAG